MYPEKTKHYIKDLYIYIFILIENFNKRILFTFSVSYWGLSSTNALAGFVKLVGLPSEMRIILGCTQKAPILWIRSKIEYFTFFVSERLRCAIIFRCQYWAIQMLH